MLGCVFFTLYQVSSRINAIVYKKCYTNYDTLILGDSHVRFLSEAILPNSLNLYRGGQSYKEAYHKLCYFNEQSAVDKLFLACSYHNFSNLAEQKIYYDYHSIHSTHTLHSLYEQWSGTRSYGDAFTIMVRSFVPARLKQYIQLLNGDQVDLKTELDVNVNYDKLNPKQTKAFDYKKCDKFAERRCHWHYTYFDEHPDFSEVSFSYFNKILEYCKANDIELYPILMPLHPCYREKVPKKNRIGFQRVKKYLSQENIQLVDYESVFDDKPRFFKDPDHCSIIGGKTISQKLKKTYFKSSSDK